VRALGADHPEVATSLNDLGGLYQQQGAYNRAELFYDRALRTRERALGLEHLEVARTLNNLAVLHQTQGPRRATLC
jgi:tetratricopeptide (TPR) repeat protein